MSSLDPGAPGSESRGTGEPGAVAARERDEPTGGEPSVVSLSHRRLLLWAIVAVGAFHLAYAAAGFAPVMIVTFVAFLQLSRAGSGRMVLYAGWLVGICIYGPQLFFFWSIFHQAAIVLWLILGSWLALYLLLQRFALRRLGPVWGVLSAPVWWVAVEYFRSELYALRFSWVNAGYLSPLLSGWFGMYGAGFFLMLVAAFVSLALTRPGWRLAAVAGVMAAIAGHGFVTVGTGEPGARLEVAGVQFEEGSSPAILEALDSLYAKYPGTSLFVLSEYSFDSSIPPEITQWCARHRRWLIAGGKQFLDPVHARYRNTAFVIGPDGAEIFQQAKSRPIQFFDDGLPAAGQAVWDSPWGKIGLCICYDLSYTRVTDELIRQGAQMIIVPTMDVEGWGKREHILHARVAPVRAAEYGVPIFRLCSSGISEAVTSGGQVIASAPFPGQGQTLSATLSLPAKGGHLPIDRYIVWPCMLLTVALIIWQIGAGTRSGRWFFHVFHLDIHRSGGHRVS